MVQAQAQNMKSGWKSVFAVLSFAASDTNGTLSAFSLLSLLSLCSFCSLLALIAPRAAEKIVRLAFELVESIMSKHWRLIADSFFVECVNCLIAFAKAHHFKDVSQKALAAMVFCAGQLAGGNVCPMRSASSLAAADAASSLSSSSSSLSSSTGAASTHAGALLHAPPMALHNSDDDFDVLEEEHARRVRAAAAEARDDEAWVFTDEDQHIKFWFPLLTGFSEIVSHPHIDVRTVYVSALIN